LVDKMLVVHMFCTALDNPAPATIVLISGDIDFALPLAALRLRRYHIVLMLPEGRPVNVMLKASAHRVCVLNDLLFPPVVAPSASISEPATPLRATVGSTSTPSTPSTLVPLSVQARRPPPTLLTPQSLLLKASPSPSATTTTTTTPTTPTMTTPKPPSAPPSVNATRARSTTTNTNNNNNNDDDDDNNINSNNNENNSDNDDDANEIDDDELLHDYELPAAKIREKSKVLYVPRR
jgi:hypothetical protein